MSQQPLQGNSEHNQSLSMTRLQMMITIIRVSELFLTDNNGGSTLPVKVWEGKETNGCLDVTGTKHTRGQRLFIYLGRINITCRSTKLLIGLLSGLSSRYVWLRCKTSKGMTV